MNETLIKDVTELLKVERLAILSADFERMERIADKKEAVIERLKNTSGFGVDALDRLKKLQIENNALLNASREGIVQVNRRLGSVRKNASELATYSASGEKSTVVTNSAKFELKA